MHILLCYSKTTALDLKMWIHMMAGEHQLEVKEVACESEEFEKVLSDEAADESLAAIVGMDNAGKAVLQVHDGPKLLIILYCRSAVKRKRSGCWTLPHASIEIIRGAYSTAKATMRRITRRCIRIALTSLCNSATISIRQMPN